MLAAAASRDEDVGRLHVAVHEPAGVRGVERACHLRDDRERALGRQAALADDDLLEIGGVDVAHRDEQQVAVLARFVHRDDVRVVDRRQAFGLHDEAPAEGIVGGKLGREDLEGHLALQPRILRKVHRGHAAPTQESLDAVSGNVVTGFDAGRHGPGA